MKSYFYVLHSEKLKRFYSGVTTLDIHDRLENHLNKFYGKNNFTQKADDWALFLSIPRKNSSQARNIKIHIEMKYSTHSQTTQSPNN